VIIDNATAAEYYEKVFLDDWANHAAQDSAQIGKDPRGAQ